MDKRTGERRGARPTVLASQDGRRLWRRLDPDARQVLVLVAGAARVRPERLLARGRKGHSPLARQLAMYLCHVGLGRTLATVGRMFGRDRSTVSYACAKIEDMREERAFEDRVALLEARLETACRTDTAEREAAHAAR